MSVQSVTRKQNPEESLQAFLNELLVLSKACNSPDVTAEVYRNELVRDAFINGLTSHEIRQCLLENNELTLDQAFDIANSLSRTTYEIPFHIWIM